MIQLTKDLAITSDDHCYTVGKLRQRAGRGAVLDNPKYYTTVGQAVCAALDWAMRLNVADGNVTTLRQFIEEQERQRAELERLIAPLNGGKLRQSVAEDGEQPTEGNRISEH